MAGSGGLGRDRLLKTSLRQLGEVLSGDRHRDPLTQN